MRVRYRVRDPWWVRPLVWLLRLHSPSRCIRYAAVAGLQVGLGHWPEDTGWCCCRCRYCYDHHPAWTGEPA